MLHVNRIAQPHLNDFLVSVIDPVAQSLEPSYCQHPALPPIPLATRVQPPPYRVSTSFIMHHICLAFPFLSDLIQYPLGNVFAFGFKSKISLQLLAYLMVWVKVQRKLYTRGVLPKHPN